MINSPPTPEPGILPTPGPNCPAVKRVPTDGALFLAGDRAREGGHKVLAGSAARRASPPVAVFGASGFVGRALVPRLGADGVRVRAVARDLARARGVLPPTVELARADLSTGEGLDRAVYGVESAYYLIVSFGAAGRHGFAASDREAARRFVEACDRSGVRRIIYLGGLGDEDRPLSEHLTSRREVARILGSGSAELTQIRAAMIVGAGGASFEMAAQLVERLPVMVLPRWVETRSQPIALRDAVEYLAGVGRLPHTAGRSFDAGGPEVLRYWEVLLRIGERLGRVPRLITVPVLTPSLSAHWVGFITEVDSATARPLVDGLTSEAVVRDDTLRGLLPFRRTAFDAAVDLALAERSTGTARRARLRWRRFPRGLGGGPLRLLPRSGRTP